MHCQEPTLDGGRRKACRCVIAINANSNSPRRTSPPPTAAIHLMLVPGPVNARDAEVAEPELPLFPVEAAVATGAAVVVVVVGVDVVVVVDVAAVVVVVVVLLVDVVDVVGSVDVVVVVLDSVAVRT